MWSAARGVHTGEAMIAILIYSALAACTLALLLARHGRPRAADPPPEGAERGARGMVAQAQSTEPPGQLEIDRWVSEGGARR